MEGLVLVLFFLKEKKKRQNPAGDKSSSATFVQIQVKSSLSVELTSLDAKTIIVLCEKWKSAKNLSFLFAPLLLKLIENLKK